MDAAQRGEGQADARADREPIARNGLRSAAVIFKFRTGAAGRARYGAGGRSVAAARDPGAAFPDVGFSRCDQNFNRYTDRNERAVQSARILDQAGGAPSARSHLARAALA